MKQFTIRVTVAPEKSFWVGIFERTDKVGYAVARKIFGEEPTDPQLYEFISTDFYQLKFTKPKNFKLIIKRKNPKRLQREIRKEMAKAKGDMPIATRAQDMLRLELENNKKLKKIVSKTEKEMKLKEKFLLQQLKKKKKKSGR